MTDVTSESATATAEKSAETPAKAPAKTEATKPAVPERRGGGRGPRKGGRRDRKKEPKEFEESILQISRVTRVVKGGRRMRFLVSVVIGDKKGRVGFGLGKSSEVLGGIQKAVARAKKNLVRIPTVDGTIAHEVEDKFKASKVLLFPAPKGKGVVAGGAVRKILELAGVKDVLSKSHGSRNKINVARATFMALAQLQKVEVKEEKSDATEAKGEALPKKSHARGGQAAEKSEKKVTEKKPVAKKAPAKKATSKETK